MTENKKKHQPMDHKQHEAKYEEQPGRWLFGRIAGSCFVDIKGREFLLTPEQVKSQVVVR